MVERADIVDDQRRPFEWWMTSHLALALAFNCFLPVLLPAYVLSIGGTAMDIALAMSMAGLFALIGPSIGGLAVRHRAHRLVQTLGVLGMAIGLGALALSGGDSLSIVLAIAVMGVGAAAVAVAAPTFILGTDLPADMQERQLTWLQLNLDVGKIFGGLVLGVMAAARLPFPTQFRVGGLAIGLLSVLVWTASRSAALRIRQPEAGRTAADEPSRAVVPLKTFLLLSLFGVPVVVHLMGSMTMLEAHISTMVTVSGLVGIGLYFLTGRWMVQSRHGLGDRPRAARSWRHRPWRDRSCARDAPPRRGGRIPGDGINSRGRVDRSGTNGSPVHTEGDHGGCWCAVKHDAHAFSVSLPVSFRTGCAETA